MFTGREYDSETDLYSCRARMYSPALGRFLQPDPIGYADSMNLYQYCGNNPINRIDPHGQMWGWVEKVWDWFWGNASQEVADDVVEKAVDKLYVRDSDSSNAGEGIQAFVKTEGLKEYREQAAKEAAEQLARKAANQKTAIQKINNIANNHLKKSDFRGAAKDIAGNPVIKGKKTMQHLKEMEDSRNGLQKAIRHLQDATDPEAIAARNKAIELLKQINDTIGPAGQ